MKAPLTLQTAELDVCGGELSDISPDIWEVEVELISSVVVKDTIKTQSVSSPPTPVVQTGTLDRNTGDRKKKVAATVNLIGASTNLIVLAFPTTPSTKIRAAALNSFGKTCHDDASVVYPVVPAKPGSTGGQWVVRTHPNGSPIERTTDSTSPISSGRCRITIHRVPLSLPGSPPGHPGPLSLWRLGCDFKFVSHGLMLMPVSEFTAYIDAAVILHIETRTSFITWALRTFPVSISRHNFWLIRVFILFKGVVREGLGAWSSTCLSTMTRHCGGISWASMSSAC
ncbi:hypothetical protein C8R43DRAFT_1139235 [Mycena crocata]|nr:hypothetical protein C8R43DRAFT_1139235 [Mycena crocata]